MSTVSPLGTALTVPRSHPVTGMMSLTRVLVFLFERFFFVRKFGRKCQVFL